MTTQYQKVARARRIGKHINHLLNVNDVMQSRRSEKMCLQKKNRKRNENPNRQKESRTKKFGLNRMLHGIRNFCLIQLNNNNNNNKITNQPCRSFI